MNDILYPPGSHKPARQIALRFTDETKLQLVKSPIGRDVSALATIGKTLFCACDETSTVECLIYDDTTGSFGDHRNISLADFFELPGGADGEMDIEGLAVHDNSLWITGSHSFKRHSLKEEWASIADLESTGWDPNRGFVGRVSLVENAPGIFLPDQEPSRLPRMVRMGRKGRKGLRKLLKNGPLLIPFMNVPAKENGFDIEGLAVVGSRVVFGLRGPVIGKTSLLVSLEFKEAGEKWLKPEAVSGEAYRLHSLDLGGFGIRDLLADGDRLLVLAGPTQAIEGVQRVFAIEDFDASEAVIPASRIREVLTLPMRRGCDHAEGIARFTADGDDFLLVDYDSPAEDRYSEQDHELLVDAYPFPA